MLNCFLRSSSCPYGLSTNIVKKPQGISFEDCNYLRAIDVSVPQSSDQASSEILPLLREPSACCNIYLVMLFTIDWFIANVAECVVTRLTGNHVVSPILPCNLVTMRTFNYCPDIDIRVFIHTHVLLYHLLSDFDRLQMWFLI